MGETSTCQFNLFNQKIMKSTPITIYSIKNKQVNYYLKISLIKFYFFQDFFKVHTIFKRILVRKKKYLVANKIYT